MPVAIDIHEIQIQQVMGHWVVHINGEFFCSADSYSEAIKEVRAVYSK